VSREGQNTKESIFEMVKELRDVIGPRPISEKELAESKGNMILGFPRQFQSIRGVARQVSEIVRYDLPLDEWKREVQDLATITAAQATQAARDHIDPDALVIIVVGDREKIEPGIRELDLGEVNYITAGR